MLYQPSACVVLTTTNGVHTPPLPRLPQFVLENLLGAERFAGLDLFMAGDDVSAKKPDPTIYRYSGWVGGRARRSSLALPFYVGVGSGY